MSTEPKNALSVETSSQWRSPPTTKAKAYDKMPFSGLACQKAQSSVHPSETIGNAGMQAAGVQQVPA